MKTKLPPLPNDRNSRLVVSVAVGLLVFGLVVLFALLVADVDVDDDSTSRRCPGYAVGTVELCGGGVVGVGRPSNAAP